MSDELKNCDQSDKVLCFSQANETKCVKQQCTTLSDSTFWLAMHSIHRYTAPDSALKNLRYLRKSFIIYFCIEYSSGTCIKKIYYAKCVSHILV